MHSTPLWPRQDIQDLGGRSFQVAQASHDAGRAWSALLKRSEQQQYILQHANNVSHAGHAYAYILYIIFANMICSLLGKPQCLCFKV